MKPGRNPAKVFRRKSWGKWLDHRPVVIALAGPNGAGKTTFFESHMKDSGLRFLNADVLAGELEIDAYGAARILSQLRNELVKQGESFIFETVFSDPVGDKLKFLKEAATVGYTPVVCFIGIANPPKCAQRVAMRVSQGGHDVSPEKLTSRFPRILANLKKAIRDLPYVLVFDNDDLRVPFRHVAVFEYGKAVVLNEPVPVWLQSSL